jgi:hypothetical protein
MLFGSIIRIKREGEKMNQPKPTISSGVAVLVVLVSAGPFRVNLACAGPPPSTTITLSQQDATGPTPSILVMPSGTLPWVITGVSGVCTIPGTAMTAPVLVGTVTNPGFPDHAYPIVGNVVNFDTFVYHSGPFPEVLAPGASVSFATLTTLPTGATCSIGVTKATSPDQAAIQLFSPVPAGDLDAFSLSFWQNASTGATPAVSFTAPLTDLAVVNDYEAICSTSSAESAPPTVTFTGTTGGSPAVIAITPESAGPNTFVYHRSHYGFALDAGTTLTFAASGPFSSPATCSAFVDGLEGPASSIKKSLLYKYWISGRAAPSFDLWASANTGSTSTFAFTASTQRAFLGKLDAVYTTPSPLSSAPAGALSIMSGGSLTTYAVTPKLFGSNIVYSCGPYPSPIDPRGVVTFSLLGTLPGGTVWSYVGTGVAGADDDIYSLIFYNRSVPPNWDQ